MYLQHMVLELQFIYSFSAVFVIYIVCVCLCDVYIGIYIVGLYPTILKYISGILDLSLFLNCLRLCLLYLICQKEYSH